MIDYDYDYYYDYDYDYYYYYYYYYVLGDKYDDTNGNDGRCIGKEALKLFKRKFECEKF